MCLLGPEKLNLTFNPFYLPRSAKFCLKTGLKFFSTEILHNGENLTGKQPSIGISQLLSSCCYLLTVSNSSLLSVQRPRPASHAHFRHSHIPELICGVNSSTHACTKITKCKAAFALSAHTRVSAWTRSYPCGYGRPV